MTDHLTPDPDARARIQQLGQKELLDFFNEVPASAMRSLAAHLPRVDGFRRGSPAGIVQQKDTLARRLTRPTPNEYDFNALYMVWRAWIDGTLPNAPLIQNLIEELEQAANEADNLKSRRIAVEQHTDTLLEKLKKESHQNQCTRESIERLYTFSPLPETAAAHEIISAAKCAADVARETTFSNLPKRLDQDEHEIQTLKSKLDDVSRRVTAISAGVNTITNDFEALRETVGKLNSNIGRMNVVEQITKELHDGQARIATEQRQHAGHVEQLTEAAEAVRRDVDALRNNQTQADRISPIAEQLAELTRRVDTIGAPPQPAEQTENRLRLAPGIGSRVWCVPLSIAGDATAISSKTALVTAFVNALLPIGLRKSAAQVFAEECAATVAARQAILLHGAFASRVAQSLAAAVGGRASARLAVPIGMQDSAQLRLAIEDAFAPSDDSVGGLAIEGLNHAPLDITREILADCVDPVVRDGAVHRRIAVFATLSRGLASLGIEPEAFELGPVFDLDYLQWRTNPTPFAASQGTFLSAKTDQTLFAQLSSASVNTEEAFHLAQALAPKRNPAIERGFVRAYQALHLLRSDQKTVTPLHSLFYGWLLPYWHALGLSKEQVDNEFDGGKVHGAPADARLTAMFEAEFPEEIKGGAS